MAVIATISNAAIQAVQDANVRSILRSLSDFLAVRNGDTGSGKDAFLTIDDLANDSKKAEAVAGAIAQQIGSGVSKPGTPMEYLGQQLEDRILSSAAWQAMFSRIDLIAAPDSVPGSAAWLLLQEAKKRGAEISTVNTKLQTTTESLATTTTMLTASIKDNAAAILNESKVRADAASATATRFSLMETSVGQSFSAIQNESILRNNIDNALAQAINTMWARVGNNEALVREGTDIAVNNTGSALTKFEQLQAIITDPVTGLKTTAALKTDLKITNDAITGLQGKWGVSIDLNGYVTGVSLNSGKKTNGKAESSFIVLADTFSIGAPGRPDIVPFAIDAQTGLVRIRGDLVATGSVTGAQIAAKSIEKDKIALKAVGGAQIDDLAVDTLKIANNAVTVPYVGTAYGAFSGAGMWNWISVCRGTIYLDQPGMVFASSSGYIAYGKGWVAAASQLLINGVVVSGGGGEEAWINATHSGGLRCGAGPVTVELQFCALDSRAHIENPTIFIQGAKR